MVIYWSEWMKMNNEFFKKLRNRIVGIIIKICNKSKKKVIYFYCVFIVLGF